MTRDLASHRAELAAARLVVRRELAYLDAHQHGAYLPNLERPASGAAAGHLRAADRSLGRAIRLLSDVIDADAGEVEPSTR